MLKLGLKLWSHNLNYLKEAESLYKKGLYSFLELYVIPDSTQEQLELWKGLDVPYIIHAPHWKHGVNLARKDKEQDNIRLISLAQKFAVGLKADKIIVHPGVGGVIEETGRQLKAIGDKRILIENKPYFGLDGGLVCNGTTPEEIGLVMKTSGAGFCLDIGHAICSANAHKKEWSGFVKEMIALEPAMFHLSDGKADGVYDSHDHFGKGSYDIKAILKLIPENASVTIETVKDSQNDLEDFVGDVEYLRGVRKEISE